LTSRPSRVKLPSQYFRRVVRASCGQPALFG
jgi:hypothetical protein